MAPHSVNRSGLPQQAARCGNPAGMLDTGLHCINSASAMKALEGLQVAQLWSYADHLTSCGRFLEEELARRYREAAPATLALLQERCEAVAKELILLESRIQACSDVGALRRAGELGEVLAWFGSQLPVLVHGMLSVSGLWLLPFEGGWQTGSC